jgi:hypothetical protein
VDLPQGHGRTHADQPTRKGGCRLVAKPAAELRLLLRADREGSSICPQIRTFHHPREPARLAQKLQAEADARKL